MAVKGLAVVVVAAAIATGCGGGGASELPSCSIAPVEAGALRTSGTSILDQRGRVITLRGVNAGGRSKFPPYAPFDFDDYDVELGAYLDRARDWGFDLLRVPFSWNAIEPTRGQFDEQVLSRYDRLLDAAFARGMWTIVDFHQDVYAENFCGDGFPAWTLVDPPAPHHDCPKWFDAYTSDDDVRAAFDTFWANEGGVRDDFAAMWSMMATRHADRPGVIGFEIINEPDRGTGNLQYFGAELLPAFYVELAGVIRSEAPQAMVFVDASGSEAVIASTRLQRPNIDNLVFAPHYYQPGALFGGGVSDDVLGPLSGWADVGIEWDVPVLLGEFGIIAEHPDAAVHMQRQFEALDVLGMHGTAWEYSTAQELWNEENLSLTDADGTERPAVEGVARPYARALAGRLESMSYDTETRMFRLAYDAEPGGVSEIAVPKRLYANVAISGTGACVDRDGPVARIRPTDGATRVEIEVAPVDR